LKKEIPVLPLWLSPTQVRLCSVNDEHVSYCEDIADKINDEGIRVDIDDRSESVGRKIRDAEKEWIPYILVVGDDEIENNGFVVRKRKTGEEVTMELDELTQEINDRIQNYPYKPLPLPKKLSTRPVFRG
ncbi:MAG: His/Gly/Thr/Pro-type tRNA ligase C-terminal domain-containing protein, partial [Candidatus Aenigmatarchaeota archaeon]